MSDVRIVFISGRNQSALLDDDDDGDEGRAEINLATIQCDTQTTN